MTIFRSGACTPSSSLCGFFFFPFRVPSGAWLPFCGPLLSIVCIKHRTTPHHRRDSAILSNGLLKVALIPHSLHWNIEPRLVNPSLERQTATLLQTPS